MNDQALSVSTQAAGDGELLTAAARRDAVAFREIVDRHYRPVFRVVWRMTGGHADCEDIAQEAFLKLWQNPLQVREGGALRGWLMRVAANSVIDRSRKSKPAGSDSLSEIADGRELQDMNLDRDKANAAIDQYISALPERQRLALTLVYYEGLSNIDAASVLETTVEAVESLLSRARRTLKQKMSEGWRQILDGIANPSA